MQYNKRAFTLIELLVVVLIIGILSVAALPQYEKAVEKSRVAEARIMLKALYENRQLCYLEFDSHVCNSSELFDHLTIALPGEILDDDDCIDVKCVNTKDWQYGMDNGDIYANRVINGNIDDYPYFLTIHGDGSIECTGDETEHCKWLCGGDGCTLQ